MNLYVKTDVKCLAKNIKGNVTWVTVLVIDSYSSATHHLHAAFPVETNDLLAVPTPV